jgi:hypothetical protein
MSSRSVTTVARFNNRKGTNKSIANFRETIPLNLWGNPLIFMHCIVIGDNALQYQLAQQIRCRIVYSTKLQICNCIVQHIVFLLADVSPIFSPFFFSTSAHSYTVHC